MTEASSLPALVEHPPLAQAWRTPSAGRPAGSPGLAAPPALRGGRWPEARRWWLGPPRASLLPPGRSSRGTGLPVRRSKLPPSSASARRYGPGGPVRSSINGLPVGWFFPVVRVLLPTGLPTDVQVETHLGGSDRPAPQCARPRNRAKLRLIRTSVASSIFPTDPWVDLRPRAAGLSFQIDRELSIMGTCSPRRRWWSLDLPTALGHTGAS